MALTDKLTAIADAIREKTGKSDLLTLDDMPVEIANISGSSDDVRYVTFMNGDEVVYVKPVAVGDDCVDVVAKGIISAPTKESTAQYNFTFAGWDTYNANHVDGGALKAVTENRTVYACYTSTVRSYTITYYDGDTVLKTETLAYGSIPAYIPEKDGYSFTGWNPELATVTGNASYYSQWIEALTFAGASWSSIARVSEAGEAQNYFALGDERIETLVYNDTTYNVRLRIADFNKDNLADGTGKAGITIICHTIFKGLKVKATDYNKLYPTGRHNSISWIDGDLYDKVKILYNGLPDTLKNVTKNVTKEYNKVTKTGAMGGLTVTLLNVDCECFVPSVVELGGTHSASSQNSKAPFGEKYAYYNSYSYGYRGTSRKVYSYDTDIEGTSSGDNTLYWLARDVTEWQGKFAQSYSGSTKYTDGLVDSTDETYFHSPVLAFCI